MRFYLAAAVIGILVLTGAVRASGAETLRVWENPRLVGVSRLPAVVSTPSTPRCGSRAVKPDQGVEGRDAFGSRLVHARRFGGKP